MPIFVLTFNTVHMIEPGKYHTLKVVRESEQGFYITKDDEDAVLLPNRYIPTGLQIDDEIEVFVYNDSEGRLIATTLQPKLTLHEFALLQVTKVTDFGAFMDWGIAKELLVPFREQERKLRQGEHAVIYLYYDEVSERLVGSAKIRKFLDNENITVEENEKVETLVYDETELGYKSIVNKLHDGLIYKNEIFQEVTIGDKFTAYVKKVRTDNKIDLHLQPPGYNKIAPNADRILQFLQQNDGWLPLNDKSSPEEIKEKLNMSKKTFKKAIGHLYKIEIINIKEKGISLK
ncbi:MAG: S1-like domain-containing RNA-binding protein [Bacteroidales bacterium]